MMLLCSVGEDLRQHQVLSQQPTMIKSTDNNQSINQTNNQSINQSINQSMA